MYPYKIQPSLDPKIYKKTWTNETVVGRSLLNIKEKPDNNTDKKILSFIMELNESEYIKTLLLKDRYHFEPEDI